LDLEPELKAKAKQMFRLYCIWFKELEITNWNTPC